ncbi:di/tricarboxylate transporter [Gemmobacter caeni]|uniref:Di/tricarboxylate transporter n=1 Tax=Gemmobacter caeni TaxID=589035 RepID=A0A2T6BB68_9RHOB|nr:SLC13 family permease [Gemmobacter caeni]PTX53262.1 di/tricarboxylate transporter [Gemmobacter caeni]TWJ05373.1 di/tricarboxylate transporter [Gemmobacter caeni]
MTTDQGLSLLLICATVLLFLSGRLRHDIVALSALIAAVTVGLVPADRAFDGFAQPAVITVACVLVLSRALQVSGAVDWLARNALPSSGGPVRTLLTLCGLGAFLSAFMNNVGALALLMPVALQIAPRAGLTAGQALMPLAFGTVLGGTVTLIGTPPNLIVAGFRARSGEAPFAMFDFTPVGLAVTLAGLAFITLVGWRLVPKRQGSTGEDFDTGAYMAELTVPPEAAAIGMTLAEIEAKLAEAGGQIVAMERRGTWLTAPRASRKVIEGDLLVMEADLATLIEAAQPLGLKLAERDPEQESRRNDEVLLREYVVRPDSALAGSTPADLGLRSRYGINLLAVARSGQRAATRLREWRIRAGDVLLLQGQAEALSGFSAHAGFIPLAERDLHLPRPRQALLASGIMAAAVAAAALGFAPPAIAFTCGMLAVMITRLVPLSDVYDSIDWSVIVLLAAMMPVADAMESSGAAKLVAETLMTHVAQGNAVVALGLILVVTMTLSDVMNNAATAAVMCPITLGAASALSVNPDAFLMAVAIGASCSFLTPIGHQNNTLILGPGGFRFGDYWRLGLPLEAVVAAVAIPVILWVFPLQAVASNP